MYPNPGWYLGKLKQADKILEDGHTFRESWNSPLIETKEQWRNVRVKALMLRINKKGNLPVFDWDNFKFNQFAADQRDLHNLIHNRIRVYQFRTKEVRQRFGHLLSSMED